MKNVVSFSGGRTSAYLCYLMIEKFGRENVDFVFMDTGAEHPKTYEFIRKVNEWLDLNLVCLRVVVTDEKGVGVTYKQVNINDIKQDLKPFSDFIMKYSTPTIMGPKCTDRMKSTPSDKYCDDKYGKLNYNKWLGMRIDEQHRIKKTEQQIELFEIKQKKKSINLRYLAEISDYEKRDVLDFWKKQPFDLDLPEHLGNCVFCIKKGANKIALAARQEPEMARAFMDMINTPQVPKKPNEKNIENNIMYRNHHSLESIIKMYEDFSEDEIMQTIRSMKREESGSCSESCEATFSSDDFELEIQE